MAKAPGLIERAQSNLFWVTSRLAMGCYRTFPLFGRLRASIAIIRDGSRVLMIRRNDGRGLCFPGGLAYPWETDERALIREVEEETGLHVTGCEFAFRYDSAGEIPVRIAVFQTQAEGELRRSWEGRPDWVELAKARAGILRSQEYVVERLVQGEDMGKS
ncbi:MAG TPA: NUDIX domain-containing protein [Candidatus Sulfotelmatobacter sp.]